MKKVMENQKIRENKFRKILGGFENDLYLDNMPDYNRMIYSKTKGRIYPDALHKKEKNEVK